MGTEVDAFDFPAGAFPGALVKVGADGAGIEAGTLDLGQGQEGKEICFDLGEWAVMEIDAEAVPDYVADFFADIDDAEIFGPGDVHADIQLSVEA